jgi:hypothetical protein
MKKILAVLGAVGLAAAPAAAATFAIYPTAWDAKDADNVGGAGVNIAWQLAPVFDFEMKASYYEQLESEPFDNYLLEGDSPFVDAGLKAIPVELGFRFNPKRDEGAWHPYLGAGGAYYALDSDSGDLDDEIGWYASAGSAFGNGRGADFYAELSYRFVEGEVSDFGDLDDDGLDDTFDIDLSGPVGNVGVVWHW